MGVAGHVACSPGSVSGDEDVDASGVSTAMKLGVISSKISRAGSAAAAAAIPRSGNATRIAAALRLPFHLQIRAPLGIRSIHLHMGTAPVCTRRRSGCGVPVCRVTAIFAPGSDFFGGTPLGAILRARQTTPLPSRRVAAGRSERKEQKEEGAPGSMARHPFSRLAELDWRATP